MERAFSQKNNRFPIPLTTCVRYRAGRAAEPNKTKAFVGHFHHCAALLINARWPISGWMDSTGKLRVFHWLMIFHLIFDLAENIYSKMGNTKIWFTHSSSMLGGFATERRLAIDRVCADFDIENGLLRIFTRQIISRRSNQGISDKWEHRNAKRKGG